MATSGEWHEKYEQMSEASRNFSRAIKSVQEELEAVDWYNQRAEATKDAQLKRILEHNRDEEIEHAMMALEWLRRTNKVFDEHMRTYLFSKGDILEVEENAKESDESDDDDDKSEQSEKQQGGKQQNDKQQQSGKQQQNDKQQQGGKQQSGKQQQNDKQQQGGKQQGGKQQQQSDKQQQQDDKQQQNDKRDRNEKNDKRDKKKR